MRSVVGLVACVASALGLAACGPLDAQYYREGIGTDLYRTDLPEATRILDLYVDHICRQADLAPPSVEYCSPPPVSPAWATFVQAGLNDIDLRCDAYLAWLDNKKRSAKPILQQIADTRNATEAIMRLSGVGPDPIVIVGTAFGFAANTFTNVTSRLVLEVDQTTVQSVVLTSQKKYRIWLKDEIVNNKPTAIHALRSYLRLCMPFTIETEINTSATLVQRGGAAAIAAMVRDPLVTPATLRPASSVIVDPTRPLPSQQQRQEQREQREQQDADRKLRREAALDQRIGTTEEQLPTKFIQLLQKSLCVGQSGKLGPPASSGTEGSPTRVAIRDYLAAINRDSPENTKDVITEENKSDVQLAMTAVPDCSKSSFLNAYEIGVFGVARPEISKTRIAGVQGQLIAWLAAKNVALVDAQNRPLKVEKTGILDTATRAAIRKIRETAGINPKRGRGMDHTLQEFLNKPLS